MTEIIRTKTKASGGVTEEELAKMKVHSKMWIDRILRTTPTDPEKIKTAIQGLYRVSDLTIVPEVVLVQSPIQMVFGYGAASALIEKNGHTDGMVQEICDKIAAAIAKSSDRTKVGLEKAAAAQCRKLAGENGIKMAKTWNEAYQGGAYWAQYDCYITAMRDIIGLDLPVFEKYKYWEEAAIHGTMRVMHENFCIVVDFPVMINIDEQNRSHGQEGPSHKWTDGWSLFYWHGVAVPENWIMDKENVNPAEVLKTENIEQRRAGSEIIGWAKILDQLNAKVIDEDGDPEIGTLLEVDLPDSGKERFLKVKCGTGRTFALPVPPEMKTALEAQSWTWGMKPEDFVIPEVRT